ncbi:glycosyl hydrolase family 17 protein [Siccirubricoccus sp. G192]|uniref:glycoside hydrolase family 17 protein n=1 Tax=Siccirubricoccus sp. G192 TaxID=2849651 RepID=UPI001C2C8704|nr:glycosyl hydrolase family 17 protein [Siccirubricoccus sp. G192]MBV1799539.1 glycoside hydrolase [Siccirubricoccus sp. G192]
MSRLPPALLALFLLLLTGLLWWLPNRPQAEALAMPAARFNSVSFAPFRPGQSPLRERFPTTQEVEEDIALLAPSIRGIRTYASLEGDYDIAAIAARHGLKLWNGAWLGPDARRNERELAQAIEIANHHPETVERVVVGNEVLLRRDLPVADLAAALDQVRAAVRQPVTYADVWEFWEQFPELARHVDIITIHILPYWEDQPTAIDAAMAHAERVIHRMRALFPGKPIAIGEIGWPSRGRWREDAAPSRVNQAVFLRRFIALAQREGLDYNLIEAFDQEWKYKSEGTVGAAWGLFTADRAPKFPLHGAVVENPTWPLHAGAAALLGLGFWLGTLRAVPGLPGMARAGLAVLGFTLGNALAFAWAGTMPYAFDEHLLLAAWVNLAGQALLAGLLLRRAALLLAGQPPEPVRSGAQATATLRDLLRFRLAWRGWRQLAFQDLSFLFLWTAMVLQLLLLIDPRYRDFPLASFAVPLVAVAARALLRDLPRGGGGREEAWAGGVLALAAMASAGQEGAGNWQAMGWSLGALALAAPALLRCLSPRRLPAAAAPGIQGGAQRGL